MGYNSVTMKSNKPKGVSGIIKDENGYYKINLGKLNSYNANSIYYRIDDIKRLTEGDTILKGRINAGILKGEYEHPAYTGMTNKEIINRTVQIQGDRVCLHIKEVEFNDTGVCEPGWDGYNIYHVTAWIKPVGPKAEYANEVLSNPDMNFPISIRSLVRESFVGSILVRDVVDISTWDMVTENGVTSATQWKTAGIESMARVGACCLTGDCSTELKKCSCDLNNGNESHRGNLRRVSTQLDMLKVNSSPIMDW